MTPTGQYLPLMIARYEYESPSALELSQNSENDAPIYGEEDFERSGCENIDVLPFSDKQELKRGKKRHYHRHSQQQIDALEAFYKECAHPDDRQRKELGQMLGLEPLQIKFWFQNKRTQMKTKSDRLTNQLLREENEKLRAENLQYKEVLSTAACPQCGGPSAMGEVTFAEEQLRFENTQLEKEIQRLTGITAEYGSSESVVPHPFLDAPTLPQSLINLVSGGIAGQQGFGSEVFTVAELMKVLEKRSKMNTSFIIGLAVNAMDELLKIAEAGEPLWFLGYGDHNDALNEKEYLRAFPRGDCGMSKPLGWTTEATRESTIVMMNPTSLVEIMMDVNQWSTMFPSIVSRAVTMDNLLPGEPGNYNGALQVMLAEYQVPSPLVPVRQSLFARYCKQHQDETWAVVDASLDSLQPYSTSNSRRWTSGCLIQEMSNGYSKVIWLEHAEADNTSVHPLYKLIINSGLAFGAKRWVSTLERQGNRLASAMACNFPSSDITNITTAEGRKNLLKLAERMVISFCSSVSCSDTRSWSNVLDVSKEDIKITTRKCINDPGQPFGRVINTATSLWLPVNPRRLFDFLRDEASRTEWDILSNNSSIREVTHIANGPEQGNCVSLLRVDNKHEILILQESCFSTTGSYVVYAPVDVAAMSIVLHGGDPDYVALLPSGFAILPDGPPTGVLGGDIREPGTGGSLLTIAFQILLDSPEKSDLALRSVTTVSHLISCTIEKIKTAVLGEVVDEA